MPSKSFVRQFVIRLISPLSLMLAGFALFVGGFAYAFYFVGLPYPDAPPELQISIAYHNRISDRLLLSGLFLGSTGFIWLVGLQLLHWFITYRKRS